MIYTDNQLKQKIVQMIDDFESEVVEFKEAKSNYSFNDIGKYFSALSNEANIRGLNEAWLVFGVTNDKRIVGTEFRKQGGLQNLKKELVNGTNERLTFMEIYELTMEKCRIVLFQIPPAIRGIPTTWQGAAYAREHESISPLPMNKVDLIRSQIGMDWSKEIVDGASIEDLNPEAIKKARELFSKRQSDRKKAQEILSKLSDVEVLNTLWYKPYADTSLKSDSTSIIQPKFENRESKSIYDGRFVKDGDVIKVTAVMYDQNFDDSAVTMITNNRIAATFTNLGVSGEVYPTGINIENVTVGGVAAKKLTVTWEISVSNATKVTNITSIMKIKAIDKYGNSSIDATKATNAIGDIEIAKIDNNHPVYAEWESGKAVTNSAKADLIPFISKSAVITKEPYQINCYAGTTVDENGIRAFKVYYTYGYTNDGVLGWTPGQTQYSFIYD